LYITRGRIGKEMKMESVYMMEGMREVKERHAIVLPTGRKHKYEQGDNLMSRTCDRPEHVNFVRIAWYSGWKQRF
jgi:hypothetical protein